MLINRAWVKNFIDWLYSNYTMHIDSLLMNCLSLIKMLYWMCERSGGLPLSGPQLEHAIKRNFGGLESKTFIPEEIFKTAIDFSDPRHWPDFSTISEEVRPATLELLSAISIVIFCYMFVFYFKIWFILYSHLLLLLNTKWIVCICVGTYCNQYWLLQAGTDEV